MTLVKPASLKLSNSPRSATGPYLTLDPEESQPPGASPKRMFLIHQNSVFQSGTRLVLDVLFLSFFSFDFRRFSYVLSMLLSSLAILTFCGLFLSIGYMLVSFRCIFRASFI